jgi:DNA processing protein
MWKIESCRRTDECYPKSLKDVASTPNVLYYVGDISVCDDAVIAVIGKRSAEERYLQIAKRIGSFLAREGYTVLNGLAVGIDTSALEGAVAANGKTVAVMPCGLDVIYPKSNQKLAETIVESGGCLVSEYPPETKPQKYMFLQRDRIQAMLASKVFVVDAEKSGGTMQTVDYAIKLSRPLGCFLELDEKESPLGNQLLVETCRAKGVQNDDDMRAFLRMLTYMQMSLFDFTETDE